MSDPAIVMCGFLALMAWFLWLSRPAPEDEAVRRERDLMRFALKYYRDECSGAEPSISAFHRMIDQIFFEFPEVADK